MLDPVLTTIMEGDVTAAQVLHYRKQLEFSMFLGGDDIDLAQSLGILLDYVGYRNIIPPDIAALRDFVAVVPTLETGFSSSQRRLYQQESIKYREALDSLQELLESDFVQPPASDWDLIIAALVANARRVLHTDIYQTGVSIVNGTYVSDNKRAPALNGIEDARKYIQQRIMKEDTCRDVSAIEGDFHENLSLVEQNLNDVLANPDAHRCYTGFRHIDARVTIGVAGDTRLIGLLGFLNHGKSGVLLTMLYNMLQQNKRILFVPCEFSPMETWQRLAFLHLDKFPKLAMPSLSHWRTHPGDVTPEHLANLTILIDDLRDGKSLPGRINVIHASTWPEIVDHLNAAALPYDVLAIDYVGHLRYEGKDRRDGISAIFKECQLLTTQYRDNRGIVVITPLQVNKQGLKDALDKAAEGQELWGTYDGGAVDTFTDAARDMDLIISVFQAGYLASCGEIKVSCMKSRGPTFSPFILTCDPRTRYFRASDFEVIKSTPKPKHDAPMAKPVGYDERARQADERNRERREKEKREGKINMETIEIKPQNQNADAAPKPMLTAADMRRLTSEPDAPQLIQERKADVIHNKTSDI